VHGLYGVSDNWLTIASQLESKFRIILADQRNHGKSPHSDEHTYKGMSEDLYKLIVEKTDEKVILLGHSMGGKTVMRLALEHPEIVDHLVVVDIAPKDYGNFSNYAETTSRHDKILEALLALKPETMSSRSQMDAVLKKSFPGKALRQFLLKNIKRNAEGKYYWQLNLDALLNNMPEIMDGFSDLRGMQSNVPTLFIRGEKSPYIKDEDTLVITRMFPGSQIVTIPDAGHWVHAEQPELFLKTVLYFLD
jgi:esterase